MRSAFAAFAAAASLLLGCASGDDSASPASIEEGEARAAVIAREWVSPTTELLHRGDGSTTAVISGAPRVFREEGGQWRPISVELKETPAAFTVDDNLVRARLPRTFSTARARFEARSGAGFEWAPNWPEAVAPLGATGLGDRVRYPLRGALEGATDEVLVLRGTVKREVVLHARAQVDALPVGPDGSRIISSRVWLDEGAALVEANGALTMQTADGVALHLPAPYAFERQRPDQRVMGTYDFDARAGTLDVRFPEAWLKDPARTFPLVLDPPATTLANYTGHVGADDANGLAPFIVGPDAIRVGAKDYQPPEYYHGVLRFDVSALSPSVTVSSVAVNLYFDGTGSNDTMDVHFGRLTLDPESATPATMWNELSHGTQVDYAVVTGPNVPKNNCACWINGGNPATQTGTNLGAAAVSDLQASLSTGRFRVGVHVPAFVLDTIAFPDGIVDPNSPELYVTFTGGSPSVSLVTPESGTNAAARTVTLLGTHFTGQGGTTAALVPRGGGASTPLTTTYVSAGKLRVEIPSGQAVGVYDVVVTTAAGSSATSSASRYTVTTTAKTWTGGTSSSWSTAGNWNPTGAPVASDDVVIPSTTNPCVLDVASAQVHSVKLTGGTLRPNGNTLIVDQDLSVESGTVDMGTGGTLRLVGSHFLNAGTFTPGTGTVEFASASTGRQSFITSGRVFFDDFERGAPGWTNTNTHGSPYPWALQENSAASPLTAWYQRGKQTTMGAAALTSPAFSLAGKTTASLVYKHRYRINTEDDDLYRAADGYVLQVSTDGTNWTSIAPTATSAGLRYPKATGAKCASGTNRTANPVVAAPGGLFAGEQDAWVQEVVDLTPYVGNATVRVRFWSGWDNCNDFAPYEGLYVDDVSVIADAASVSFHHLRVANSASVVAVTPLQVGGNLDVTSANAVLEVSGKGMNVTGALTNAGRVVRGRGGALTVGGAVTNTGTLDLGDGPSNLGPVSNSGTILGGTGDLNVSGSLSSSGTFVGSNGGLTVSGDLTVSGGNFRIRGSTVSVPGNLTINGALSTGRAALTWGSTAASTFTGSGAITQANAPVQLFADGFESGNLTAGGWVAYNSGVADAQVIATPPGNGAQVMSLSEGGTKKSNYLEKALSTAGQSNIWVSFWRSTTTANDAYLLELQYSVDGGTSWRTAFSEVGIQSGAEKTIDLSSIDPAVDNNPNFRVRFHGYINFTGSTFYIDDVRIEAGTPGLGAVTVVGTGTRTVDTNARISGKLDVSAGTLQVGSGRTLSVQSEAAISSAVASGASLAVSAGGTLALSPQTTLNVNGALSLLGGGTGRATVASTAPANATQYALNVAGSFSGDVFTIDSPGAQGLYLAPGSTVPVFAAARFDRPRTSGALLTLGTTSMPATIGGAEFLNSNAASGAVSVDGSLNNAQVTFRNATGALANEGSDRDFGGATPGNIVWSFDAVEVVVVSATEPAPGTANSVTLTIEARDAFGNPSGVHPGWDGTVAVSGSAIVTPTAVSLPSGSASTTVTVTSTAAQTVNVTLTETSTTTLAEVPGTATFIAGPATRLAFGVQPQSAVAGTVLSPAVTAAAQDDWGNAAASTAQVTLALGANPGNTTLLGTTTRAMSGGTASFNDLHVDVTGQGYTLIATAPGLTQATSATFDISPAPAQQLVVSGFPSPTTAGVAGTFTVTARDAFGNVAAGFTGQVAFTSSDAAATLPAAYTFAAADLGVRSFNATLRTAGTQSLTATAVATPTVTGAQTNIQVQAAAASSFTVGGIASPVTTGTSSTVTVQALDASGAVATAFTGTIVFTSTDANATLPGSYTFTAADQGVRTFPGVVLRTPGTHTVTVADAQNAAVTGAQSGIVVVATNGEACSANADCASSVCAQGVCCDRACGGACESCALSATLGTCTVVPDGTACPDALYCNGAEACVAGSCQPGTAVVCADPQSPDVLVCSEAMQACVADLSAPPNILEDALLTTAVGEWYAYNADGRVRVQGAQPVTFSRCGGPADFHVEPTTGAISWRPAAAASVQLCVSAQNANGADTYAFTVQVVDGAGAAPTASFTVTPATGPASLMVTYDGSASTSDPASPLVAWRWDFGDMGPAATGATTADLLVLPGGYQPELTVTDALGRRASSKMPVRVLDGSGRAPPLARIVATQATGDVELTASFSCDCQPGDAPVRAYEWDFGDVTAAGETATHTFGPGRYRVRLTVTDANGLVASDSVEVSVRGAGGLEPPFCRLAADPPAGPAPLSVAHQSTYRGGQSAVVFHQITFDDGTQHATAPAARTLSAPGTAKATLEVRDEQGLRCVDRISVTAVASDGAVPPSFASAIRLTGACGVPIEGATAPVVSGTAPFTFTVEAVGGEAVPAGLSVDGATGELSWTPGREDVGTHTVSLRASGPGGSAVAPVEVEVTCGESVHLSVGGGCGAAGAALGPALIAALAALTLRRRLCRVLKCGNNCQ